MSDLKFRSLAILGSISRYFKTDVVYIAKGGFWLTISQVVLSCTAFGLSIIYANVLAPETLGIYKYIISVSGFFAIATLNGMGTAITQAVARGIEGTFIPAMKVRIRWGLLGGLASLLTAGYYIFKGNSTLGIAFGIVAIFVPFMDSLNLYDAFLGGKKDFRRSSVYYSIAQTISTVVMILAAVLTKNVFVLVLAYFGSWTILRLIMTFAVIRNQKLNSEYDPQVIADGKHLSFINIINTIAGQIDKVLIFQTIGAVPLAVYSIAIAPIDQAKNFLTRVISMLAMPKYAVKDSNDLKKHVYRWTWKLALILIPITAVYIYVSPYLFSILFPKYAESIWYSQLYALTLIPSLYFLPHTALSAQIAKKELYYFNLISSIAQIVFLFVGGYYLGVAGVVLARVAARYTNLIASLVLLKKY